MTSNDQSSTLRGHATHVSYQFSTRSGGMAVKRISAANLLTFDLNGQLVTLEDESGLPTVSEGDEVEVTGGIQGRHNVFAAAALTNLTTGQAWQFSMRRVMGRGAASGALSGCMGTALSVLGLLIVGLALTLAACGASAPSPTHSRVDRDGHGRAAR
jgi:hypothetical protein